VVEPTVQGGLAVARTRVPKYVRSVPLQVPDKQPFNAIDLQWVAAVELKQHFKVAAVPMERLDDFVRGEAVRGATSVYCRDKGHKTGGVITSKVGDCIYGKLKGARGNKQHGKSLAQAGESQRRSKIVHGESIKKNCAYGFTVKEFAARPNVAFIKFHCTEEDMVICASRCGMRMLRQCQHMRGFWIMCNTQRQQRKSCWTVWMLAAL
jgi:hypothetical protein